MLEEHILKGIMFIKRNFRLKIQHDSNVFQHSKNIKMSSLLNITTQQNLKSVKDSRVLKC